MALGGGRAGDGTLGRASVRLAHGLGLAALSLAVGGCNTLGAVAGVATGAAAATASANPAVAYGVAVGSKAATDAVVRRLSTKRHEREQDQIVRAIGALRPGQTAPWAIRHRVPLFDDAHGSVTVVRDIPNALAPCKEVVFVVVAGRGPSSPSHAYVTTACRQGQAWKWATAEPATERWRFLH